MRFLGVHDERAGVHVSNDRLHVCSGRRAQRDRFQPFVHLHRLSFGGAQAVTRAGGFNRWPHARRANVVLGVDDEDAGRAHNDVVNVPRRAVSVELASVEVVKHHEFIGEPLERPGGPTLSLGTGQPVFRLPNQVADLGDAGLVVALRRAQHALQRRGCLRQLFVALPDRVSPRYADDQRHGSPPSCSVYIGMRRCGA
jgi:hypothetical protein